MPTYGSNGSANTSIPKFKLVANVTRSNSNAMYTNTTPSALVNNQVVGLYGVGKSLVTVAEGKGVKDATPGWVVRRSGMGPVTNVTISAGGSGYSNNDLLKLTANGSTNTTANVVTNSTGGVVSFSNFTVNNGLFPNSAFVTVAISNTTGGTPNGTSFSGSVILGGRAGRHHNEVLVVVPSMTVNATQNSSAFPNA